MVFAREVLEQKAKADERFARRFEKIVEKHDKQSVWRVSFKSETRWCQKWGRMAYSTSVCFSWDRDRHLVELKPEWEVERLVWMPTSILITGNGLLTVFGWSRHFQHRAILKYMMENDDKSGRWMASIPPMRWYSGMNEDGTIRGD